MHTATQRAVIALAHLAFSITAKLGCFRLPRLSGITAELRATSVEDAPVDPL
jgi:hypothetical protein